MSSSVIERVRAFGASVDGSLLDEATWTHRHKRILAVTWLLGIFNGVFTLVGPRHPHELVYALASLGLTAGASISQLSRRQRELLVAVAFMVDEVFLLRYVGNFTLAPLAMIILTFYQDWAPLAIACLCAVVLVLLAWLDPGYYNGTRGFAVEVPHTGMTLRAAAVILAAVLALAIWRSGTQFARDQLTGMLSRAGAERSLDHELSRGRKPAVWVCDIDNFRTVNQVLGPETGDQLLRQMASRLSGIARVQSGGWFCARLGGDTFMLASRHVPNDAFVASFAYGLEQQTGLAELGLAPNGVPIHFSVGAATAIEGERGGGLIRAAERNMREAKGRGSRRVVVEERIDRAVGYTTPLITAGLYGACEREELVVYLQPIVALSDGAPVGAEALVRWDHPERGLMLPGEFLPDAEKDSALMAVLSRAVGNQLLTIAAGLIRRHGADWLTYGYSYNLAAIRLRDPMLVETMGEYLASAGFDPAGGLVHLEITEGALMDIEHGVPKTLAALGERGYRIALDDFGTGHSSLAHLRDFPLDCVKIDKSFIRSMHSSPTDRAVVQAVIDIASASGLKVVAEGVETEEQRDLLLSLKPDMLAQGWLYAKALPANEFEDWVLGQKRAGAIA